MIINAVISQPDDVALGEFLKQLFIVSDVTLETVGDADYQDPCPNPLWAYRDEVVIIGALFQSTFCFLLDLTGFSKKMTITCPYAFVTQH